MKNNAKNNISTKPIEFEFVQKGFLNKDVVREELITEEAQKIANMFVKSKLTSTQLRAFFNDIKSVKNRLKDDGSNYEREFPLILMIKSKAEYKGASKGTAKITKEFKEFLVASVDRLWKDKKEGKGKEVFDAYVLFFEAIVGYFYGMEDK